MNDVIKKDINEMKMIELQMPLLTTKYTRVLVADEYQYNAPNRFLVVENSEAEEVQILGDIHFQEGSIQECGVNGVNNEDLINMVLCRLEHFQNGPYVCKENQQAINHLEEALMWLRLRTTKRERRNVEGTAQV